MGDFCCGSWTLYLWHAGLVAPRLVGSSSPIRDQMCVPWAGRQIVIHWTTEEVPQVIFSFEQMALLLTFVPLFGLRLQRCY